MLEIGKSQRRRGQGEGGLSLPYTAHADLFAWDFTAPVLNGSRILRVNEMSRGAARAWVQPVAASQPDAVASGARFTADLSRAMNLAGGGAVPLNGASGVYFACNVLVAATATEPRLIRVYDGVDPVWAGRLIVEVLNYAGHQPRSFIDLTDHNAFVWRQNPAITIADNTWVTIEEQHDFTTPANNRAWVNGVEVAARINTAFAKTSYPSTNSLGAFIGGNFSGVYNAIGIAENVLPANVRQSFSGWLNSVRPV